MEQFIFNDSTDKRVIFGYGAIRFSTFSNSISLIEIRPPQGAGTQILSNTGEKIGEWEDTGRCLTIYFGSLTEVDECERWLDQVEAGNIQTFTFKGVFFDYTKLHESGLSIMRSALKRARFGIYSLMAC